MAACTEPDCERPAKARGLCRTHYAYRRRHQTLPPPVRLLRTGPCKAEDCDRPLGDGRGGLGYCGMHYQRLTKIGSLDQPVATAPDEDRFWAKVDKSAGPGACWPWLAGRRSDGYANVWWHGRTESAHRIAYELAIGPISPGLVIDHVLARGCVLHHCVNPAHLEAVPPAINNARQRRAAKEVQIANGKKGAAIRWGKELP